VNKLGLMLIAILVAGTVSASTIESEIVDRISKVGEVCVEGGDCGGAATTTAVAASDDGVGAVANYATSCAICHASGVAGAPKLGDIAAWQPRIAKGLDSLYGNAINGLAPGMPAKGMCFSCSDDDIKILVDYMVDLSQ
jgi:cytochrome c5